MRPHKISVTNVLLYLLSYVYIIIFFVVFKLEMKDMIYCFIHATVSSFTMNCVLKYMEKSSNSDRFSLSSMYLFISAIYLHLSPVKYVVNPLYPGYITNQWLRLWGSILCAMVICISTFIWYYCFIKTRKRNYDYKVINTMRLNPLMVWGFVIACGSVMIYTAITGYLVRVDNPLLSQLSETVLCITLVVCVLNIKEKKSKKKFSIWNYQGILPIATVMAIALLQSLISGKRHMLMTPIIVMIAIMLCLKKIKDYVFIKKMVSILPLAVAIFSSIVFLASDRFQKNNSLFMSNLVYRFDMTDFAITEAERTSFKDYSIDSILEPIQLAIPGSFSSRDKAVIQEDNQYKKILAISGLYTRADYNDTVFSMGAEIGGYLGFFLVPILLMVYYEFLDRWISSKKEIGNICKLSIVPYFCGAENVWQKFVLDTRTYSIVYVLFYVIVILIVKNRICRAKILENRLQII